MFDTFMAGAFSGPLALSDSYTRNKDTYGKYLHSH